MAEAFGAATGTQQIVVSAPQSAGITGLIGSRDASRSAFKNELITDGEAWMDMIKARNQTSHTYNLDVANDVAHAILTRFYPAFVALRQTLSAHLAESDPA